MPLQKQLLSLPLVGGVNEKDDALLSLHPQQMINCVYRKNGAVSKRYGYDPIGAFNKRLDGTTPPTCEQLATYGNELLRIGGGQLDSYNLLASSEWLLRGRVPECIVEKVGVTSTGTNGVGPNPAIGYANGYLVAAYIAGNGTNWWVYADVTNVATGARVFSSHVLETGIFLIQQPRVVASGTSAFVAWGSVAATGIVGAWLDLTTMTWGANAYVAATAAATPLYAFDIDMVSPTEVAVVFELAAGANRVTVQSFSSAITGGAFVLAHAAVHLATADTANQSFSLRYTASRLWVAYCLAAGDVKVGTVTPSFALETTPFSVLGGAAAVTTKTVGIEATSATTCLVSWSLNTSLRWNEATYLGVVSYSPCRVLLNAIAVTRPLVRNARAYVMAATYHATHGSQFMVDLSAGEALPLNGSPRMVACVLPRQLPSIVALGIRDRTVSNWVNIATDVWETCSLVAGIGAQVLSGVTLRARFDATWTRTTAQVSNVLVLGGGALTLFDGSATSELGFAYEPDIQNVVATQAAGGLLTALGVYGYLFVYSWQDAQQNRHRSATSLTFSVTMTAGNTQNTLNLPCLQLTNKATAVSIEVYRTAAAGSVFLYVGSVANAVGTSTVNFVDTASDASIASNATVYTTGGVLQHDIPAGGPDVLAWKGGLLLHASDDDSLWISGEVLQGEGPWFSPVLNITSFEGGRITALALLDATPVLFKATSSYYLQGDPPTDLGASTIGAPLKIQTEAGCIDAASIVTTPMGIGRAAVGGLYLLNRSLVDTWIGSAVEDSMSTAGFAGVAVLPSQSLVRWLLRGTGIYNALNFDYTNNAWSKDLLNDAVLAFPANATAATLWNGAFVWISATGNLYQESTTNFSDVGVGGAEIWVPMTFETAFEKAAGVAGYQRVWRAIVTGTSVSDHGTTITITTDKSTEAHSWSSTDISFFPNLPTEVYACHVGVQKGSYMKVKVADFAPGALVGSRAGMTLRDISLELGIKPPGTRLGIANRK